MNYSLILIGIILLICIASSRLLYRFGVPSLLVFLMLGMVFGSDISGLISFDDFNFAKQICSVGLVFIMFYGGFGTNWKTAKPVAVQGILLSSVGTFVTAGLIGLFCTFVLKTGSSTFCGGKTKNMI